MSDTALERIIREVPDGYAAKLDPNSVDYKLLDMMVSEIEEGRGFHFFELLVYSLIRMIETINRDTSYKISVLNTVKEIMDDTIQRLEKKEAGE